MIDTKNHSKLAICTIASANYIAYAKTLADSVAEHQPDADFYLLVVDRKTAQIESAVESTGLNVVFAEDLGIDDIETIAIKFDIVELNTALKPTMLKRVFGLGYQKVLYLDPDIRLFSSLAPVTTALDESSIVFTPHSQAPAMDGYRPSDIDFMRTGIFNLGFVGLRASEPASKMLDWWEERCLAYGFIDTTNGIFVDQKWMDLVPCYFDGVYILKHLGCNVAYWNLHERQVAGSRGNYSVGEDRLCFFHFSGVKANEPQALSRHQNRHQIAPNTPLAELVSDYCHELNKNRHSEFSAIPYTYAAFDNGVALNKLTRRAACFATQNDGRPFSASGPFYAFAKSAGLLEKEDKTYATMVTRNFDPDARVVRLANALIRLAAKIIGSDRVGALTRYLNVIGREDNLSRVLSKTPLDFSHVRNKSRHL